MRVTFLGTGTSHGVPAIGCDCTVCRSPDPRNQRDRSSLYVQAISGDAVVVDATPEFRRQCLRCDVRRVDAVLLTHAHADHIMGLDDLRRFNELQGGPVPIFGAEATLAVVRRAFAYAFEREPIGPTRPALTLCPFPDGIIQIGPLHITPLPCRHGPFEIHGFLFESGGRRAAYFPDCNQLPDSTLARLSDLDLMILDGLRDEPHPTHFTLSESVEMLRRIGARRSFITHICHALEHETTCRRLPPGIEVPWDGLSLQL
ncbi:MAG: MBL fold metallo-hydrolase [Kiritimatiellae bacterium]|nr:MBL fold metallo-hydrolase [Kiritimatiellia bacterium]